LTAQTQTKKNEIFIFKDDHKRLSDTQAFSKVYYQSYYKKPITTKWYNTYLAYYHRIEEDPDLTVDDPMTMEQQVNDSIRMDVTAGLLDITIPAGTEVDGDTGDEEGGDDIGEGEDEDKEVEDPSTGVMVPGVPLWYRNAVMKRLWENASESQKDAVERYKMECGRKTAALADVEMSEGLEEDGLHKVTRLESVIRSVTSYH
jgi:hypothetical protein